MRRKGIRLFHLGGTITIKQLIENLTEDENRQTGILASICYPGKLSMYHSEEIKIGTF